MLLGVELGELRTQPERALGDEPETAPLEVRPQLEHLGEHGERLRVALVTHDAGVLVLDLAPALADLGEEHGDGLQDVERLEPGRDERLAVLLGDEPVRPVADDRRHVAGPEEPVEPEVG